MKTTLITFILIGGIAFVILSCTNKTKEKKDKNVEELNTQPKKVDLNNNPYQELRSKAFNVTPKELGITSVSYTHLDVYKRQILYLFAKIKI